MAEMLLQAKGSQVVDIERDGLVVAECLTPEHARLFAEAKVMERILRERIEAGYLDYDAARLSVTRATGAVTDHSD